MAAVRRHPILRTAFWRRRAERLFVSVAVLLPIPIFAASGLSLPLPGPVERLAAALVPFADAATTSEALPARGHSGSIVRLSSESQGGTETDAPAETSDGVELVRTGGVDEVARGDGRTKPADEPVSGRDPTPPTDGAKTEEPTAQPPGRQDETPREEPARGQEPGTAPAHPTPTATAPRGDTATATAATPPATAAGRSEPTSTAAKSATSTSPPPPPPPPIHPPPPPPPPPPAPTPPPPPPGGLLDGVGGLICGLLGCRR